MSYFCRTAEDVKIDGLDISPLLLGESSKSSREAWFYYRGTKLEAVRSGAWKLVMLYPTGKKK